MRKKIGRLKQTTMKLLKGKKHNEVEELMAQAFLTALSANTGSNAPVDVASYAQERSVRKLERGHAASDASAIQILSSELNKQEITGRFKEEVVV